MLIKLFSKIKELLISILGYFDKCLILCINFHTGLIATPFLLVSLIILSLNFKLEFLI